MTVMPSDVDAAVASGIATEMAALAALLAVSFAVVMVAVI
jgi:hypothetical protein